MDYKTLLSLLIVLSGCATVPVEAPSRMPATSTSDQVRALDARKKTICSMTLNSEDEREAFRAHLKDFNFVELVNPEDGKGWLESAVKSGVRCDVLILSGHFGGKFFGKSGQSLATEQLQDLSCRAKESGLLEAPREIFLMGCNTLAGKTPDFRTPEEYVQVLMADGFSLVQAEQVAAFRYSPLGSSFGDRMSRIFWNVPKIYGFGSKGPAGNSVRGLLDQYLNSIPNYSEHLDQLNFDSPLNRELRSALSITAFVETAGSQKNPEEGMECYLSNGRYTRLEKLKWLRRGFIDPNRRMEYIGIAEFYLRNFSDTELNPEEAAVMAELRANQTLQSDVRKLMDSPVRGMTTQYVILANFARRLKWLDDAGYETTLVSLLGNLFPRDRNFTHDEANTLCSLNVDMRINEAMLFAGEWDAETYRVISCYQDSLEDNVALRYIKMLMSSPGGVFQMKLEPGQIEEYMALIPESFEWQRESQAWKSAHSVPGNSNVIAYLLTQLKSSDHLVFLRAATLLGRIKNLSSEATSGLTQQLEDPTRRCTSLSVLQTSKPAGFDVIPYLTDADPCVRQVAAHWLVAKDVELKKSVRLTEALRQMWKMSSGKSNRDTRSFAGAGIRKYVDPKDLSFVQMIVDAAIDGDYGANWLLDYFRQAHTAAIVDSVFARLKTESERKMRRRLLLILANMNVAKVSQRDWLMQWAIRETDKILQQNVFNTLLGQNDPALSHEVYLRMVAGNSSDISLVLFDLHVKKFVPTAALLEKLFVALTNPEISADYLGEILTPVPSLSAPLKASLRNLIKQRPEFKSDATTRLLN